MAAGGWPMGDGYSGRWVARATFLRPFRGPRTDNVLTMPSLQPPTAVAIVSGVTEGELARRAFELSCERGREDGDDVDDRLNAERELRDASAA
jgi:hypothetical protein